MPLLLAAKGESISTSSRIQRHTPYCNNYPSMSDAFSKKQQAALARAPSNRRSQLRQDYRAQNAQLTLGNASRRATMALPRLLRQPAPQPSRAKTQGRVGQSKQLAKMWNPLSLTPIPALVSDGHAHVTTGMDRCSLSVGVGTRAIVVVSNVGSSGLIGTVYSWSNMHGVSISSFVPPTLSGMGTEGNGPTAARAMKCSLTILNSTPSRKVGGTVAHLNAAQRIVWPEHMDSRLGTAQADALFDQIMNQQQTQLQTGEMYKTAKTLVSYPCNETEYVSFRGFAKSRVATEINPATTPQTGPDVDALNDINRFLYAVSTATPFDDPTDDTLAHNVLWEPKPRPMSTLVFLVDKPSEVQDYTFTARGSWYTRWPMEHVLGQHHPPIPTASHSFVNAARDAAEAAGHGVVEAAEHLVGANPEQAEAAAARGF